MKIAAIQPQKTRSTNWGGRTLLILVAVIPLVISFLLFWVYPIFATFIYSFTRWQGFSTEKPWVGLDNYIRAFQDPIFLKALTNTFIFVAMYLPIIVGGGLLLALLIDASGRLKEFFRMVYFIPVVTSVIATAFVWRYMFQPRIGIFNMILDWFHLPAQSWLLDVDQALLCVVLYTAWQSLGLNMVWFLAGLTTIDRSYYDAACVDGANVFQKFWYVTLPLLRPTFVFVIVIGAITAFQVFGPIYIMTSTGISSGDSPPGGPSNSTMVVVLYQWLVAFRELDLGYGAAMGIILLVLILALTGLQLRLLRTREID